MVFLTIFTPTYNRAQLITNAYNSLIKQKSYDFEWIIVDDGSTDNTSEIVENFIKENSIKIKYYKQVNSGKHIAINQGLEKADSELFLVLDSDDELTADAVSLIRKEWQTLQSDKYKSDFGGLVFNKRYTNGNNIGNDNGFEFLDETIIDFRFKRKVTGDKLEIFRTETIKKYPFPDGIEKFCPEALVWNRIGSKMKFRFFNKAIYVAEYLPGGLSSKIVKIRRESPHNTSIFYSELLNYDLSLYQKIRATTNFWRFSIYDKQVSFKRKFVKINFLYNLIGLPLGMLAAMNDTRNLKVK